MNLDVPEFFFRTRENGAIVFRINTENRQRRLEMEQIAIANIRSGEIKPHAGRELSAHEVSAIKQWMAERSTIVRNRKVDDILRAVDHLNEVTQWAQSKATDDQLEAVTDQLLLTMHDLRSVLTRKKSTRILNVEKQKT